MEALNQASARAGNFLPVHTERLKALLIKKEWDQCIDAAQQCLVIDSDSIEAHTVICVYTICYEGHFSEVRSAAPYKAFTILYRYRLKVSYLS